MKNLAKILMLAAAIGFAAPTTYAQLSVGLSVRLVPPPLPVYVQPECPEDGYLWQPGYWAYDDADGYYWVPGVWVAPPDPGLLWTPCYWGWDNGVYLFHNGYWGPHVGFYGGINYGFGYPGEGFYGGVWSGRSFRYNTAVFNVNRTVVHNVYVDRSVHAGAGGRTSFNGPGGVSRKPDANEQRFSAEHHVAPTHTQISHQQVAAKNPAQHFAANHGRPATVAMAKPGGHMSNAPAARANAPATRNPARAATPAARANAPAARNAERTAAPAARVNAPAVHRTESHPANAAPAASRPQRAEQQHTQPQARPEQQPRATQQPRPAPQQQSRPAQQPRPEQQPRPAPQRQPPPPPRPAPQPHAGGGGEPRGGGGEHGGGGRRPPM